jgi:hypothetical protein
MRTEAGGTLIEVIVAAALGAVILGGGGIYYLTTLRVLDDSRSQAFLQRQGTVIMEELGREIRTATSLAIVNADNPATCWDAIREDIREGTDALNVSNPDGTYCFYLNGRDQIIRCKFDGDCVSARLLDGSLAVLTASAWMVRLLTPCEAKGGTCDLGVCSPNPTSSCSISPAARIAFSLSDGRNPALSFGATLTTSRHQ